MEIRIRQLKVRDRKRFSAMIEKVADKVGDNSFLNIISSALPSSSNQKKDNNEKDNVNQKKSNDESAITMGVKVLKMLLQTLEDETQAWFIDLLEEPQIQTAEEFQELPIDAEMQIIDQMVTAQESSSFFTIASRLYNKIEKLQKKFGGAKG